jgi:hypothetical protein
MNIRKIRDFVANCKRFATLAPSIGIIPLPNPISPCSYKDEETGDMLETV